MSPDDGATVPPKSSASPDDAGQSPMPLVSLIVATVGRTTELAALCESVVAQQDQSLEIIIVDQNRDDRLVAVLRPFADRLTIRHVRSSIRNNSHARNVGIRLSGGDIVAFPDDDCLYPPGVLSRVRAAFAIQAGMSALSGAAQSPQGGLGSGRWASAPGEITPQSVWHSVIAFNLFVRRRALLAVNGFDERFGVGARFGSCEENDLVLRIIENAGRAFYDPSLLIIHPDKRLTPVAVQRALSYGQGMGQALRRHRAAPRLVLRFLVRPLGGAVLNLGMLRASTALYYWNTFHGRLSGYLAAEQS